LVKLFPLAIRPSLQNTDTARTVTSNYTRSVAAIVVSAITLVDFADPEPFAEHEPLPPLSTEGEAAINQLNSTKYNQNPRFRA
jgi:hypothetical protein